MMAGNVAIDTLSITKRLEASGMPKKQAEAVAQEQVHFANSNLASKTDIEIVRKDMTMLRKDMTMLRKDMTIKMGGMAIIIITVLGVLMQF